MNGGVFSIIIVEEYHDILFKMNTSSVLYIIVLVVVCSLSGVQGQRRTNPTEEEGKYL